MFIICTPQICIYLLTWHRTTEPWRTQETNPLSFHYHSGLKQLMGERGCFWYFRLIYFCYSTHSPSRSVKVKFGPSSSLKRLPHPFPQLWGEGDLVGLWGEGCVSTPIIQKTAWPYYNFKNIARQSSKGDVSSRNMHSLNVIIWKAIRTQRLSNLASAKFLSLV